MSIRRYALSIITGVFAAARQARRRRVVRDRKPDEAVDIVVWAVPFGLLGDACVT
jgi:prolipoprotein diacylglyceryltransferase